MKEKTKVLLYRWGLLLAMVVLAGGSLVLMKDSYDPLARYPYATEENRQQLLEALDAEDIDYIITQQLRPEQFLPWMDQAGFDIRNTLYYEAAANAQPDTAENIVQFVNRYKDRLSLSAMDSLLKQYRYDDLSAFFDAETGLELVTNPDDMFLFLEPGQTVYKYVPEGLEAVDDIYLQPDAARALQQLQTVYGKVHDTTLEAAYGYVGYEALNWLYLTRTTDLPGGENELQLGWTVVFAPQQEEEAAEEETEWLAENAWRYGFVLRDASDPLTFRYVGPAAARELRAGTMTLEDLG